MKNLNRMSFVVADRTAFFSDNKGRKAKVSLQTEVRKFMNGKETKLEARTLLSCIGDEWLAMVGAEEAEAKEQTGVDELERMFRLKDPRN